MNNAPEKIWIDDECRYESRNPQRRHATEYTRSDLVAEQAAENERLKHDQTAYQSTIDYLRKRAEEAEALASTGAVKVKPLEWVELNEGKAFRAPLPVIGSIRIEPYGVCGWWEVLWSMPGQCDKLIPDVFDTPDEAKAAAQADYQRRILSALDPHPRATKPVDAHETANLSDKPEGQQEPVAWEDREDDMSAAILNSHPTRSKSYNTYERAMELVSNRHSKGALVMLVNHLLIQAETRPSEQAAMEAG